MNKETIEFILAIGKKDKMKLDELNIKYEEVSQAYDAERRKIFELLNMLALYERQ